MLSQPFYCQVFFSATLGNTETNRFIGRTIIRSHRQDVNMVKWSNYSKFEAYWSASGTGKLQAASQPIGHTHGSGMGAASPVYDRRQGRLSSG